MAMPMTTKTPYRDEAIAALEAAMDGADDLADTCAACVRAMSGWCDKHEDQRVLFAEIEPVITRLEAAGNDREARAIIAAVPSLAGLVNEMAAAA